MIIHYIWKTKTKINYAEHAIRFKQGWFLLGFIPLYICTSKYTEQP